MALHTDILTFNPLVLTLILLQIFAFKRQYSQYNNLKGPKLLHLSDLSFALYGSLLLSLPLIAKNPAINTLFIALMFIFSLYLAIAIQAYKKHSYHLNIKTLHLAIINYKEIFSGDTDIKGELLNSDSIIIILLPLLVTWTYALIVFNPSGYDLIYPLTFIYLFLLGIKVSITRWQNALILIITTLVIYELSTAYAAPLHNISLGFWIYTSFALLLLLLKCAGLKSDAAFFSFRSSIHALFVNNPIALSKGFECRTEDEEIITPSLFPQKTSQYFGLCSGANVILITLESVSSSYLKPFNKNGSHCNYYNELAKQSWVSNYHICLSPNTDTSFYTMYQGDYFQNPITHTNHLNTLKKNAYTPIYLTTSATTKNPGLMKNIGLDNIYFPDNKSIHAERPDKAIFSDLLKQVSHEHAGKDKLFLHLKNMQTHHPYSIYKAKHTNNTFERYCLAIEEVDAMLPELIQEMGELVDLNNTIIVYTADHGQSFGEMNYKIHSNSIIQPQINVPFLISHPKLQSRKLTFSSHFDLMPTLFDLLGIQYTGKFAGNSLGLDDIPFSHVLFSETRCGNLPSCFGHINKQRKVLIDASLERSSMLDLDDRVITSLSSKEQHYQKQLLRRALCHRGLVARPTNALKWNLADNH